MHFTGKRCTLRMTLGAIFLAASPPATDAADPGSDPTAILDATVAGIHDLRILAALATAADLRLATAARQRLRAAGPAGLDAFTDLHRHALATAGTATSGARTQLLEALDDICGQRDCPVVGLYWYTDLEQARLAAHAAGKPILSLRLLGDLRDELSCANSRLFRALLYPDPAVTAALRSDFILHWHSERPAPRITVDFGDGRTIESTITGNSVHYVLDSKGQVVDALPGLMTPTAFIAGLQRAADLARRTVDLAPTARASALRAHHAGRSAILTRTWTRELAAIGHNNGAAPPRLIGLPRAGNAAPIAITKMAIEAPMLGAIGEPVATLSDSELFERLADRHLADLDLDLSSISLARLARQQWRSGDPTRDAADLQQALTNLRRALALDSLRNELDLHRKIHAWFVADADSLDLDALNRRLYDQLFLTPRSDPWLGLAAPSIYSGLPGGGRHLQAHL